MPTTSPATAWLSIASSADGETLIAGPQTGSVQISTNGGLTWQSRLGGSDVAAAGDGNRLAKVFGTTAIHVTTNAGGNWTATTAPAKTWRALALSADGNTLIGAAGLQGIYTSTNFGGTWISNAVPMVGAPWSAVAVSADGMRLVAVAGSANGAPGPIYISSDYSQTWAPANAPSTNWVAVASAADGRRMCALVAGDTAVAPNPTYVSTDFGLNWTVVSASNGWWSAIASSADGHNLVGAAFNRISRWQSVPEPRLNVYHLGEQVQLVWLVPSMNFELVQSSDLSPGSWSGVTNVPALDPNTLRNELILPGTNGRVFYRLVQP